MNVEIAQRLAKRRKETGLSQEALAEKIGVSRQAVSKWERSESSPDTDNLISLAKLYGVSLDDLLYTEYGIGSAGADGTDAAAGIPDQAKSASPVTEVSPAPVATEAASAFPSDEAPSAAAESSFSADPTQSASASTEDESSPEGKTGKVKIGLGGIHVEDGQDYVHVTWRDGVHVHDGEKGEEVHVGWDGVHVNDPAYAGNKATPVADESFVWDGTGVNVNGEHFDDWREAHRKYHGADGFGHHHGRTFKQSWSHFPFPLLVVLAYLIVGFTIGQWGMGLFLFFTIPLYYLIGALIDSKQLAHFIGALYPLGSVAWFLYMAFVLDQAHPAWIVFLTIPIVEWLCFSLSSWWRRRKALKEN